MKKLLRLIPLIVIYFVIIYFSVKRPTGNSVSFLYADKIYHFGAYFTLGFVTFFSLSTKLSRRIFLIINMLLGISLEIIQGTLPYRDMSFADGVFNTLGLFLGAFVFSLLYKRIFKEVQ